MSEWPPTPPEKKQPTSTSQEPNGQEWKLLEKVLLSGVEEQRRARRWGIFFKILTFLYVFFILILLLRSCNGIDKENNEKSPSEPHIAVIEINGVIASGDNNVNSQDTARALKRAFEASGSKAIVLAINSPGGSPVQSDEIWQEIRYQKQQHQDKKVYAIIGDVGASGAYYIASAADEIYVNPSSIVGSIGVIMSNYNLTGLAQKLGVEDRTMTSGEHKAILSMTRPLTESEKSHIQSSLNDIHQSFINAVKTGRGSRLKDNPEIFSGLFWTGEQAIQLGLADKKGSVLSLSRELKLDKVVNYTIQRNALESLLNKTGTSMGKGFGESLQQQVEGQPLNLR